MDGEPATLGPEDFERAGLYDPSADDARAQLELLRLLAANGATLDEMVEASDRLPTLVVRLAEEHRQIYTVDEVAEQTGISRETLIELWRAAGFVDPGERPKFSTTDIEALRLFSLGEALVGHAAAVQFVRVLGNAASRVADAAVSAFIVNIARAAMADDPVGLELARQNLQIASLLPMMEMSIGTLLRHHLELSQRTLDQVRNATLDYDSMPLTVGFVDIVDSTVMSRRLGPKELGETIGTFEAIMNDLVASRGGRLVKLIGDEAMFVSRDPAEACVIALEAADAFRSHDALPPVRAGLAFGDLILREGDCFGPVVNLAARLVKEAPPSGVVIDAALAAMVVGIPGLDIGDELTQTVRGFDQPVRYHALLGPEPATTTD